MELKREEFKAWLESQPADREYPTLNSCECPIGCYLNAVGPKALGLHSMGLLFYHVKRSFRSPYWASRFVTIVDADGRPKTITNAEALEVLNNIPA